MSYLLIIIFLIIGIFLSVSNESYHPNNYNIDSNNKINNKINKIINKLLRQSSRWLTASQQDENPLIAVLHLNYGLGYLWALKDITTPEQIKKATGIDFIKFENKALELQDNITKKLIFVCPKFTHGLDEYLSKIAGENI